MIAKNIYYEYALMLPVTAIQLIQTSLIAFVIAIMGTANIQAELPVRNTARTWINADITAQTSTFLQIDTTQNIGNANGDNSILYWDSFNISADSRVEFIQPSASHIALNRIAPQISPSQILGRLDANGRVYLINQNGFLFGPKSSINVNSLAASTLALNINDNDFVSGDVNIAKCY